MTRRLLLLLGLAVAVASSASAQAVGACETGTAIGFLENAHLRASVFNTGSLFFGRRTTSGDGYLIPKATGRSPVFAAGLWLGGQVNGELRVAAARYGGWNFWPGPLEDAASPPGDCSAHDRIYVVSRDDIRRYYQTGELTDDLDDWPYHLGAPVIDGDGDSTNYDLRAGDQPDLIGDQAAWWVMNDAGNEHPGAGSTAPMGVDVRVLAWVYSEALSPALAQTSFYRYEITNRGDLPIDSVYAALFSDPDLGDAGDDFGGTDTLRNMAFVYNETPVDRAYGIPPAWGVQVLEGPAGLANGRDDDFDGSVDEPGERLGATATSSYINGGPEGANFPYEAQAYYRYMQGTWADGSPITAMRYGYQTGGDITTFMYPGDVPSRSFWSQINADGNGGRSVSGGQRGMALATGPFVLEPGKTETLLYAMPFAQGTDYLDSVRRLQGIASALQSAHAEGVFTSSPVERPEPAFELALSHVRPNPSSGDAEVVLTLPEETHASARIYDALGRQLDVLTDGVLPRGETVFTLPTDLAPGMYSVRVQVEPGVDEWLPFTVIR